MLKYEYEHISINKKNIKKCIACGKKGEPQEFEENKIVKRKLKS